MGSCASTHRDTPDSSSSAMKSIVSKTKKLLNNSSKKRTVENSSGGQYTIGDFVLKSQSSMSTPVKGFGDNYGSKEETFFDSQAWLESDCEDFYSVNGDFTPSRSNTPSRVSSFPGTPQRIKTPIWNQALLAKPVPYPTEENEFKPEPSPTEKNNSIPASSPTGSSNSSSPTEKKKKLSELFRDSRGGHDNSDSQNLADKENILNAKQEEVKVTKLDPASKSSNGTPYLSGTNSHSNSTTSTPSRDPKPEKEKLSKAVQRCIPNLIPSCRSAERKKKFTPSPLHNAEGITY